MEIDGNVDEFDTSQFEQYMSNVLGSYVIVISITQVSQSPARRRLLASRYT